MKHISLIMGREYFERVRTKSFIITTLLFPVFMMAMMVIPAMIAVWSSPEKMTIAVVDQSGEVAPLLKSTPELTYVIAPGVPVDSLKTDEAYDAVMVIGQDVLKSPSDISLYQHGSGSMITESAISSALTNAIETRRIQAYDIPELDKIMREVKADVSIRTFRLDDGEEDETSGAASYFVSIAMTMVLYMFIILYGQQVLTSIVEEKNNRILEVVVSSMSPTKLMLGKILGVGAVAITQLLIWAALLVTFAVAILPAITGDVSGGESAEMLSAVQTVGEPAYILRIFGFMGLYLLGGYLLYAAIFAAIGSSIDNIQDASQLQTLAMAPIIVGVMMAVATSANPAGDMAFWGSMIPLTSPMVMMARLPYDVPTWQLLLSLALLYVTAYLIVMLAAKIYRVGIFMYGQKPTVATLIRMARQK